MTRDVVTKRRRAVLVLVLGLAFVAGTTVSWAVAVAAVSGSEIVAWGNQTTVPAGLTDVVGIAAGGEHSLALRSDGSVVAWGSGAYGQTDVPPGLTDVVAVAAGGAHSLALRSDGSVVAWGSKFVGETDVPAGLADVISVSAGGAVSLALTADGTVVGWGENGAGQATPPPGLSGVVAIAAGVNHSLALRSDGTVVGWGLDVYGATTPPPGLTGVVAIDAANWFSIALKSDGTVVSWGYDYEGEKYVPLDLTGVIAIACGVEHNLALKSDGTVVGWGNRFARDLWSVPEGLTGVTAIAASPSHSLALKGETVVDVVGPLVTWKSSEPAGGAEYDFGLVPPAPTCAAVDDVSGPVACTVSGYGTTVGSHTIIATARDVAGNTTTQTRTYTVRAWALKGFYAPVRMAGAWNTAKAGGTVPLKFEVFQGATELTRTSAITSTTQQPVSCTTGAPDAEATPIASPGSSRLRYDVSAGRFIVGWKTPSTPNRCYVVTVTTSDGSTLTARYRLI